LLSSPLARVVVDDGRRFLDGEKESYDVIVVDPPPPPRATASSLLYSREFYAVIKKHLRSDGVLQMWYPEKGGDTAMSASIAKALKESFPTCVPSSPLMISAFTSLQVWSHCLADRVQFLRLVCQQRRPQTF